MRNRIHILKYKILSLTLLTVELTIGSISSTVKVMPIFKDRSYDLCDRCKDTHNTSLITHNQKGFTLIELLVVIAIIGIISTIAVALFANAQKSARDAKRISDIQEIQKALEQFYVVGSRTYPTDLQQTSTGINNSSYFPNGSVPKDGTTDYSYFYNASCPGNNKAYRVCATMETNGKGNAQNLQSDPCVPYTALTTGPGYYCVSNSLN